MENPLVPQQPRLPVNRMMIYVKVNPPAEYRQKQHGQPASKAVRILQSPDNAENCRKPEKSGNGLSRDFQTEKGYELSEKNYVLCHLSYVTSENKKRNKGV